VDASSNTTIEIADAERLNRRRLIHSDNVGPRGIMAQARPRIQNDPGDWRLSYIPRLPPLG